jgi:hypothetical protein
VVHNNLGEVKKTLGTTKSSKKVVYDDKFGQVLVKIA